MITRRKQTTAPQGLGTLRLSGSVAFKPFPFYQLKRRPNTDETILVERPGRDTQLSLDLMLTAFMCAYRSNSPTKVAIEANVVSNTITTFGNGVFDINVNVNSTAADIEAATVSAVQSYCTSIGYPTFDKVVWLCAKPSTLARSFSNPTLAVNTARQASATRDAFVSATVDITANLSLTNGQRGTITLEYADDSAFTTNVITAQSATNGNTGTLTVGLALGQTVSAAVSGIIPAGKYYRLRTTNNTGTPTFGTPQIQEVLE